MPLVKGNQLTPDVKAAVLCRYVHRHLDSTCYPIGTCTPEGDIKWLESRAFHVRLDGKLDKRYNHCEPAFLAEGN